MRCLYYGLSTLYIYLFAFIFVWFGLASHYFNINAFIIWMRSHTQLWSVPFPSQSFYNISISLIHNIFSIIIIMKKKLHTSIIAASKIKLFKQVSDLFNFNQNPFCSWTCIYFNDVLYSTKSISIYSFI